MLKLRPRPNARFWLFENDGWVKITLKPGQTLNWHKVYCNGEGWSREAFTLTLEDDTVYMDCYYDATDCDGRHSRDYSRHCDIINLQVDPYMEQGIKFKSAPWCVLRPNWIEGKHSQRDYTAEAMGY